MSEFFINPETGWTNQCPLCNKHKEYNEYWDAYYCSEHDEWLDKECSCEHCKRRGIRPLKPSMV